MKHIKPIVLPPEMIISMDSMREYTSRRKGDFILMTEDQGEQYKALFPSPEENEFCLYLLEDLTIFTYKGL